MLAGLTHIEESLRREDRVAAGDCDCDCECGCENGCIDPFGIIRGKLVRRGDGKPPIPIHPSILHQPLKLLLSYLCIYLV